MKKKELVELIQENINGGSVTSDIFKTAHPLVIARYIDMAFNTIFYNIFRQNPEELDIYGRWYYDQEVKSENGRYYCDLPCETIQLPSNSSSVRRITMVDDLYSNVFVNVRGSAAQVLNNLGTIDRAGLIPYSVSNKIRFEKFNTDITKVNIFAITPFSDLENDDSVPIPAGQDIQFMQIILQIMQKKYNDLKSDNNGN